MRVLVSACLLGENCKYSGGNNRKENGRIWVLMPTEMRQLPIIYLPNGTYLVSDTVSKLCGRACLASVITSPHRLHFPL